MGAARDSGTPGTEEVMGTWNLETLKGLAKAMGILLIIISLVWLFAERGRKR